MASDVSTISYLVNKTAVINVLRTAFSKPGVNAIFSITSNVDSTFTLNCNPVTNGNGYVVTNNAFKVTRTDISNFLATYSTVTLNASNILNLTNADDTSFLEVITI